MRGRKFALATMVAVFALLGASAQAGTIEWRNSALTENGSIETFNGSGFASITETMNAAFNGTDAFFGSGFGTNQANVFAVDFSGAGGALSGAGTTIFVLWGQNGVSNNFSGVVGFNPQIAIGTNYAAPTAGTNEIFSFGGAAIFQFGNVTIGGTGSVNPTGFAVTNIGDGEISELQLDFLDLSGDVTEWGLFSAGEGEMFGGTDSVNNTVILLVPIPPAVGMGAIGVIGVVLIRRRYLSR